MKSRLTLPAGLSIALALGSTALAGQVTFQVNMSAQVALGNFDPAFGTVAVAGEFNGWSASASLRDPSPDSPGLWVGTLTLSGAADSAVSYKFVMNGATWEGDVGPDGAQNRALTLTSQAQTLPTGRLFTAGERLRRSGAAGKG